MRRIDCIHLALTTACDRNCPECCCAIGKRPAVHFSWEYFEDAARFLCGIDRIRVTGGEPTCHPQFSEFIPKFKALFGCRILQMDTNCFRIRENAAVLHHFDELMLTQYGAEGINGTGPGDNSAEIQWTRQNYHGTIWLNDLSKIGFVPEILRGGGGICYRGKNEIAAYSGGRLYGCCVGPGLPMAASIPLTADWRTQPEIPVPCRECRFSI